MGPDKIALPTKTMDKKWISVYNKTITKDDSKKMYLSEEIYREKITIEQKNLIDRIGRIIGEKQDMIQRVNSYGERITVPLTERMIDNIAEEVNCKVGKWMLFIPIKKIDSVWKKIARAVISGNLGSCESAKVATALQGKEKYLICVYTPDYLNYRDVMEVREKLRELGFTDTLYYKPDIYTYLGIYSKNRHVKASKYKS